MTTMTEAEATEAARAEASDMAFAQAMQAEMDREARAYRRPMPEDDNDDGYDQHRDRMLEAHGIGWRN